MRLLLAEDEKALSRALVKILEKNRYTVDAVFDGEDALLYAATRNYDAVILDVMMPKADGITVLRKLRADGNRTPVLLLTAKAEVEDRVLGLDSGANDYLPKPFDTRELLARIRCMTREREAADNKLRMGNISLDRTTYELSSPQGSFRLANREFQLMEMFLAHPHRLFSTEYIMERVWGCDSEAELHVVWVYISYLRKKLAALDADIQIRASRNAGYSLEENG